MPSADDEGELADVLAQLKSLAVEVPIAAALRLHAVAEAHLSTVADQTNDNSTEMAVELNELMETLRSAKAEISALRPEQVKQELIPEAAGELDAIVEATADATNRIMDSAEKIEAASHLATEKLKDNLTPELQVAFDEMCSAQSDAAMQIFEACTFQDITGQRVTKVQTVLKDIELKIDGLLAAFGGESAGATGAGEEESSTDRNREDLLNGPQLPGQGTTQDEVDALLADFDNK